MMTLDELRAHPSYPFLDFAQNDASFLLLELFWTAVAREALGNELSSTAVPLMDAEQEDGNPILFFRLPQPNRAVRVILQRNEDDSPVVGTERPNPYIYYLPVQFLPDTAPTSFADANSPRIEAMLILFDMAHDEHLGQVIEMIRAFLLKAAPMGEIEDRALAYERQIGCPDPVAAEAYWAAQPDDDLDEEGRDDDPPA